MFNFQISPETHQQLESLRAHHEEDEALFKRIISAYNSTLNNLNPRVQGVALPNQLEDEALAILSKNGEILHTLSTKEKPFAWCLKDYTLTIYRIGLTPVSLDLTQIIEIINELNRIYKNDYFKLDNDVTDVMNDQPDNKTGFGRMIFKYTDGNTSAAQISSQLGPLLTKYKLLEWNQKTHGIAFKCTNLVHELTVEKLAKILNV